MHVRRSRLDRLRDAVAVVTSVAAVPPVEVWLPVKDGGTEVPGRYPQAGGRVVLVLYDTDEPERAEATG